MNKIMDWYLAAVDWIEDHPHWSFWIGVTLAALHALH